VMHSPHRRRGKLASPPPPVLRGKAGVGADLTKKMSSREHVAMPQKRDHSRRLITFARHGRKNPTDAEKKLWSLLRHGKLNGLHFRRQVPVAGYIIDFCCISAGLGVKADGGQHCDERGEEYDRRRSEILAGKGFRILRFSDYEILKHPEAVAETIYREVFGKTPTPALPRSTGGGGEERP